MNRRQTRLSRRLDRELADGMPAGDPPSLTEPAGDARDPLACCGPERAGAERPTEAASDGCGG